MSKTVDKNCSNCRYKHQCTKEAREDGPIKELTVEQMARERADNHMRIYYNRPLDTMEISSVPGYWRERTSRRSDGFKSSFCYFEYGLRDSIGRFVSPTLTWQTLRAAYEKMKGERG